MMFHIFEFRVSISLAIHHFAKDKDLQVSAVTHFISRGSDTLSQEWEDVQKKRPLL